MSLNDKKMCYFILKFCFRSACRELCLGATTYLCRWLFRTIFHLGGDSTVPRACDIFCHFIRISCCSLQLLSFFKSPRLVATSHLFKSIKAISDFQVLERWKQTTTFQSFKPFALRRSKELYDHDQHCVLHQIRDVQLYFPNVQTLGGGSKNSSGIFPTGAARNGLPGERMRRLWVDDDDRNR